MTLREHIYEARSNASWALCHGADADHALRLVEEHLEAMVAILNDASWMHTQMGRTVSLPDPEQA